MQETRKGSGVSVLVKNKKLPLSLVKEAFQSTTTKGERLLQVESFHDTFGPTSRRKRPNMHTSSLAEMLMNAEDAQGDYNAEKDGDLHKWEIADSK
jgi:nuclear GTP-binding protein